MRDPLSLITTSRNGLIVGAVCSALLSANTTGRAQSGSAPPSRLHRATICSAELPARFGNFGGGYVAPNGTIAMSNDGWCWVTVGGISNSNAITPIAHLASPPARGTVQIDPVGQRIRIAYKPT